MSRAHAATLRAAAALALGSAVALGLSRFAYALLLPPMRADLGWSYATGGAMNTANAAGYLIGALLLPRLAARHAPRRLLLAGAWATTVLLAAHALASSHGALVALRLACGVASAFAFVAGGLLAAQLAGRAAAHSGLVLGIYYGGTGLGIVASALIVPPLAERPAVHAWQGAWAVLALAAALATLLLARGTQGWTAGAPGSGSPGARRWRGLGFALAGYLMFGLGYIGYMTFVVAVLREQGLGRGWVVGFYVLLGVAVMASSWLWAGLLQRHRGGGALARLNALLALACALPLVGGGVIAALASGALFGAVFLSVVASTTALVRHNLPSADWPAGIAAFTVVFAVGQIVGPMLVGWVADGAGGLARGFALSAALLAAGAVLAALQRPLGEGQG